MQTDAASGAKVVFFKGTYKQEGETLRATAPNYKRYNTIYLSFLLHDQKKRNQRKVTGCVSGVAKNISHSNFGGDTTRFAQTVSPLTEILAPFLTPDIMPTLLTR